MALAAGAGWLPGAVPLAMAADVAPGGADSAVKSYAVPAGPLGEALASFAASAGVTVQLDARLVEGRRTQGLSGNYGVREGFARLLSGSGLEAVERSPGTWVLHQAASPAPSATPVTKGQTEQVLPVVTVKAGAERENATGPVQGYVAKRSAIGTKTDTPIIETPQSISVVGAEEIETLKAQSLMDALGYTAGVANYAGPMLTAELFFLRGFQAGAPNGSLYRDGSKFQVNMYNGKIEPYGLERIEVLKGASSVLYGLAGPGGIINAVSKRPASIPLRELNVELGSFNRKQVSGDFGGALTEDGTWSYRLTALHRDSDTFVDHVPDNRTFIAPALKWQPSAATSLTFLAEYQRDKSLEVQALPAQGTVLPNPNGRILRSRFFGEPGYDKYDNDRWSLGYLFEHAFSDQVRLRHSSRYLDSRNDHPGIRSAGLAADQRTLERFAVDRDDRSSALTSDTSLEVKANTGEVSHTMLFGLDFTRQRHQMAFARREVGSIDLYSPAYGSALSDSEPLDDWSLKGSYRRVGVYAQDQMKLADNWVMLVGGRQDWVRGAESPLNVEAWSTQKDKAFTGRLGLVYLHGSGLAPFIGGSQSFEPELGQDRNGGTFKPTRGKQWEAGVRYQPPGTETLLSAAIYELTKTNVTVDDPVNSDFSAQLGEVRSRGLELEAKTRVGRNGNLIAAYAYTDARTTKSSPLYPEQEGKRSGGVPRNQFSLWGDYSFGAFRLPGLKAGAGVRYVDSTRGVWLDADVPSFTLIDAMVSYSTGPWRLALNVANLTDKTYVASCTWGCFYGEPRKVTMTATYRW
ncbi:TonB-dependent receptor [Diaphorobacter nitroreducens]|uniref:TonB-dependent siderophore receptor n=1 Tax=Diaphorobacter nitroreducens TaxID=164759 RepID=UPI000DC6DD38|nr:TonB-dependent receptor [Diaphorobacter nitroreducens]